MGADVLGGRWVQVDRTELFGAVTCVTGMAGCGPTTTTVSQQIVPTVQVFNCCHSTFSQTVASCLRATRRAAGSEGVSLYR
jgi:hypothetical protein